MKNNNLHKEIAKGIVLSIAFYIMTIGSIISVSKQDWPMVIISTAGLLFISSYIFSE